MKKITKATFKSFVKKNRNNLFVNVTSEFDGMTDGRKSVHQGFSAANLNDEWSNLPNVLEHTLGIEGVYLVNNSRDYFNHYEDDSLIGIEVYNCCGRFVVAIEKQIQAA